MKKSIILFLFVLLLPIAAASDAWMFESEELVLEMAINSKLNIQPTSSKAYTDYVRADLLLYPTVTPNQEILNLKSIHDYKEENDRLIFEWDKPTEETLNFGVSAQVKTINYIRKITSKIDFPIKEMPAEYLSYIKPTENIDSNDADIVQLASQLAGGEDDLYVVVHKIASWVKNNIKYSLDTLTAEALQKPSWVLENKYGVCDELTSLFIAMNRALGVPARYISGVAYTNLNNINDFGPHAWAEVYFPDKGWVPFDIAYGQFGFVDASHIVLKESADSGSTSTKYEWRGRDVELKTEKLDIKATLKESKGKLPSHISIKVSPLKETVGFGSYNLVEATVKNLEDYYVATELRLAKTTEIEQVSQETYQLLLTPNQERKVYWPIKLIPGLQEDYVYTFPVQVYSTTNISGESKFTSTIKDPVYTLDDIKQLQELGEVKETKAYSANVELKCNSYKKSYYLDEEVKIVCIILNQGNTVLNGLDVCLKDQCEKIDLPISQEETLEFSTKLFNEGKKELAISAKNDQVNKADYVNFEVFKRPRADIIGLEYPDSVSFDDKFFITFTLEKISLPKDVVVVLAYKSNTQTWKVGELRNPRKFTVDMLARDLDEGDNLIGINVNYKDDTGKEYQTSAEATVKLENVTFLQKIIILFNKFTVWLGKLF